MLRLADQVSKSGSVQTGVWTPESDLNMCVVFERQSSPIDIIHARLDRLVDALTAMTSTVAWVASEPKPNMFLIKIGLTKEYHYKKVELIFKFYVYKGLPRNEDFVLGFMKVYRCLRPLYLAFRRLLHNLGLDDPLTGGINTFSIFLIIVGFLQKLDNPQPRDTAESPRNADPSEASFKSAISGSTRAKEHHEQSVTLSTNNVANQTNLGQLFLNLIYYYGFSFDYHELFIRPYVADSPNNESVFKVG